MKTCSTRPGSGSPMLIRMSGHLDVGLLLVIKEELICILNYKKSGTHTILEFFIV
jgi:hypothetical protein